MRHKLILTLLILGIGLSSVGLLLGLATSQAQAVIAAPINITTGGEIWQSPTVSPTLVSILGPGEGVVGQPYTFTATVEPVSTTLPLTYTWQASGQTPVTHTGGLTDTVSFSWDMTGTQLVTVTASNISDSVSDSHVITITAPTYKFYLPTVFKNYSFVETGKIIFVSNRDGNDEIYSMNVDGSAVARLTNNGSEDLSPDWSPDGSKIAFDSDRSGEDEIYVMNADGSNQTQVTTMTHCYSPQWSPDGSRIAFYTRQDNNNIIYTMNPDGSGLTMVTDPAMSGYDPYWSPDGLKIAFYSTRTTAGIYVVNADGTNQTLLLASSDIVYFAWSPDGTRLALSKTVPPTYNFDIFIYDINTGITTRLTNTQSNHNSVDWSPEGHHLIFNSNLDDVSNFEIYTMTSYGTEIMDISNNPAADAEPDWTR